MNRHEDIHNDPEFLRGSGATKKWHAALGAVYPDDLKVLVSKPALAMLLACFEIQKDDLLAEPSLHEHHDIVRQAQEYLLEDIGLGQKT